LDTITLADSERKGEEMTKKKRTRGGGGRLKLKKETLRDLDARGTKRNPRGGGVPTPPEPIPIPYPDTAACSQGCSQVVTCACVTAETCLACVRR
jgi:hypothetical protein